MYQLWVLVSTLIQLIASSLLMRINQLPLSAARWQHGSQIRFATFILWKITIIAKSSTNIKAREKIRTEFYNFFHVHLTKFKNNQILLNKISHRFLLPTICWVKETHWGKLYTGTTKGGSITVPLTSCLTSLESAVWLLTIFVFICKSD